MFLTFARHGSDKRNGCRRATEKEQKLLAPKRGFCTDGYQPDSKNTNLKEDTYEYVDLPKLCDTVKSLALPHAATQATNLTSSR